MNPATRRLAESGAALRAVFQNPALRRLQLAWAGSTMGQWLSMVALGVYAFNAGGAAAVGALGVARYVLGAIAAPPLALLADRLPRVRVMVASSAARAIAFAAMAASRRSTAPGGPSTRSPARSRWPPPPFARPGLCAAGAGSDAEELTAANVTAGTVAP